MTYEAGFCVFAFVAFCAVVVCLLYRRALVVDESLGGKNWSDASASDIIADIEAADLLSRDDVLELELSKIDAMTDAIKTAVFLPSKEWQPHDTDKMPVDWWNDVRVMFRDGTISDTHQACLFRWWPLDEESDSDILAYRIA